jgi:hypothetical protein
MVGMGFCLGLEKGRILSLTASESASSPPLCYI